VRRHHENLRPVAGGGVGDDFADELHAGELGHQVVGNQQIVRALADESQRLPRAAGGGDFMSFVTERLGQRLPDLRFVIDKKNGSQK
jgi:hypothetical protein